MVVHGPSFTDAAEHGDLLGHGTCAAAAILDLAPGSTIYSVQVFGRALHCPFERVLDALRCALEWRPDLVNLSLGTLERRWLAALEEFTAEDRARIVSPAAFEGLPSYPGALTGFTGVLMDESLPREAPVQRDHGSRRLWYASPYPRSLPDLPRWSNFAGPSFAVANVTGALARSIAPRT
jgi:hypothetical protein